MSPESAKSLPHVSGSTAPLSHVSPAFGSPSHVPLLLHPSVFGPEFPRPYLLLLLSLQPSCPPPHSPGALTAISPPRAARHRPRPAPFDADPAQRRSACAARRPGRCWETTGSCCGGNSRHGGGASAAGDGLSAPRRPGEGCADPTAPHFRPRLLSPRPGVHAGPPPDQTWEGQRQRLASARLEPGRDLPLVRGSSPCSSRDRTLLSLHGRTTHAAEVCVPQPRLPGFPQPMAVAGSCCLPLNLSLPLCQTGMS